MDNTATPSKSMKLTHLPLYNQILRYKTAILIILLMVIYCFGFHLRYEDFPEWDAQGDGYRYQGQYQMTNFDSYYYLIAAKAILKGEYKRFDEKRNIPYGSVNSYIPPLSSFIAAKLSSLTGQPLHTVAIFFPVVLAPLLGLVIFLISRSFGMNEGSSLFAAFLTVVSYSYVTRSRVGVFDTDCLNVTMMYFNAWLGANAIRRTGEIRPVLIISLFISTVLYALWWNTASVIAIFSSILPFGLSILIHMNGGSRKRALIAFSVLCLAILAIYHQSTFAIFNILSGTKESVFPLLDSISELESTSLSRFSKDTAGNPILLLLMCVGLVILVSRHYQQALFYSIPILLAFSPLFLGNRFMIFSAPALALGGAYLIYFIWSRAFTIGQMDNQSIAVILCLLIGGFTLLIHYPRLTDKLNIPSVHENRLILDRIDELTEPSANVWTSWSVGYQIRYYLERGTYADGGLSNGAELLYYLSLPFATKNLQLSANFIQFYTHSDIQRLYPLFKDTPTAIRFLKEMLSRPPKATGKKISQLLNADQLNTTAGLTTQDEWLKYLYPEQTQPIYLLLHQKMLQTVSWFKQGNIDFNTKKTIGLPLYLPFSNMKKNEDFIVNDEMVIHTGKGLAKDRQGSMHSFSAIKECRKGRCSTQYYSKDGKKISRRQVDPGDDRFQFHWNADQQAGVVLSKEMAKTAFIKLFEKTSSTQQFELVQMQLPLFQLWRVKADRYE